MCGIYGAFGPRAVMRSGAWIRPNDNLLRRGPEARGIWVDQQVDQVLLGHTRLQIRGLGDSGKQPMATSDGRYVVCFNGEIYNHQSLRRELEEIEFNTVGSKVVWFGDSDTESLAKAIEIWGIEAMLDRIEGMFALAIFDRISRSITLARDRFGEKPLYYSVSSARNNEPVLLFSSSLNHLVSHPDLIGQTLIDQASESQFLHFGHIKAPFTIYQGVFKLSPGKFMRCGLVDSRHSRPSPITQPIIESYWSPIDCLNTRKSAEKVNEDQLKSKVREVLYDEIAGTLDSEVPIGLFLSGGVDSTLVAAVAGDIMGASIPAFTVGFKGFSIDESAEAQANGKRLGLSVKTLTIGAEDILRIATRLPEVYEEPFADSSQIPTLLLCESFKKFATVALSGDGGDEIFGGYNRHVYGATVEKFGNFFPKVISSAASNFLGMDCKISRYLKIIELSNNRLDLYDTLTRVSGSGLGRIKSIFPADSRTHIAENDVRLRTSDLVAYMQIRDIDSYLHDDVLTKVDRASMWNSIEVRSPLLSRRLAELVLPLPTSLKIRKKCGKYLPRRILSEDFNIKIPCKKRGFAFPLAFHLNKTLNQFAIEHLERWSPNFGLRDLKKYAIYNLKSAHVRSQNAPLLWNLIVLAQWYNTQNYNSQQY